MRGRKLASRTAEKLVRAMVPEKVHFITRRHPLKGPNHKLTKKVAISTQGRGEMVHGPAPKSLSQRAFSEVAHYYQEGASKTPPSKPLQGPVEPRNHW
jgi:hypothetical protein